MFQQIRDHYLEQFRSFVREQQRLCRRGAAEVKLRMEGGELFGQLYCADYLKNDGAPQVVEMRPDQALSFTPFASHFGGLALEVRGLLWDDVLLQHDAPSVPDEAVAAWFERWFDPADVRPGAGTAELAGVVHSMLVRPGSVSLDLGTARPQALWEMLHVLEGAGARRVRIAGSGDAGAALH